MEVYVVYYGYDYEMGYILGVFSDPMKALEAMSNCKCGDYRRYHKVELDKVYPDFELGV
jgi:hypothetical protein